MFRCVSWQQSHILGTVLEAAFLGCLTEWPFTSPFVLVFMSQFYTQDTNRNTTPRQRARVWRFTDASVQKADVHTEHAAFAEGLRRGIDVDSYDCPNRLVAASFHQ
ncbi:uncharacterized protein EV420DRAFT_807201 [Desarmillaria tabescens]|uniref:Uncharacterized protein n=1 Tax=Armillaria tabescens TaxID=1929756 RepID=A0AA39NI26_ARMTA|nr:uncharacterized protein EV420DRAFT_807201 [Desarmillaria tabescens]KAK0466041.1 hypothetical protein EV420DRAFT_807201 [Desarmillaria tabescens]